MSSILGRGDAALSLRASFARRVTFTFIAASMFTSAAYAVVVRGHVTDALGKPVGGAHVQLLEGGKNVAVATSDAAGFYEVRSADAGRFTLVTLAVPFLPAIGREFYGGSTDVVEQEVVLSQTTVRQDVTVTATGLPTPVPQLTAPLSVLPSDDFAQETGVADPMRATPGAFLVQTGQFGGVTSLFLRGGNSTANLVLVDGVPADDVGGIFDFGTVSSTAVTQMEIYRGPDSAMYGTDAGAGVITISTPRGTSAKPVLTYSGEGGNLYEYRNEVTVGGTHKKLDYFGAFSRLDASNAVPDDRYHDETEAVNAGYALTGDTLLRFTLRNSDAVQGVPGPWDFQGVSSLARQADQDLYSAATLENTTRTGWHNLVRYGIARKREQEVEYGAVGNYLAYDPGNYGPGYVGNVVTIRGANGYSATGQVQLYNGNNYDQDSNRDQLYYQSDFSWSKHLNALFGFRYDNERGSYNDYYPAYSYSEKEKIQRTNFEYNLQFQGSFFDKLFYSAGGAVEKNHLYGIAGTPRIGLSYVPVAPATGWFHGTRLRANAATGVQEPTLALEENSIYTQLEAAGDTADIAKYHVRPQGVQRSRTYDIGVDQNILGETLVFKAGYFHNMFNEQLEGVDGTALNTYFHLNLPPIYEAYVNSLAFQAEGAEAEVLWHPIPALVVRGGYTYLATRVIQSFSSDEVAALQGYGNQNPNLPNINIGALGPLVGARPFRRAPHTDYLAAAYTKHKYTLSGRASLASRSDDSTFLQYEDLNGGNTLLLPNRDLDYGYVKIDANGTYNLLPRVAFFAQADNVLNNQHIGPIGYPGLPLTVRAGIKVRLGGQ